MLTRSRSRHRSLFTRMFWDDCTIRNGNKKAVEMFSKTSTDQHLQPPLSAAIVEVEQRMRHQEAAFERL